MCKVKKTKLHIVGDGALSESWCGNNLFATRSHTTIGCPVLHPSKPYGAGPFINRRPGGGGWSICIPQTTVRHRDHTYFDVAVVYSTTGVSHGIRTHDLTFVSRGSDPLEPKRTSRRLKVLSKHQRSVPLLNKNNCSVLIVTPWVLGCKTTKLGIKPYTVRCLHVKRNPSPSVSVTYHYLLGTY